MNIKLTITQPQNSISLDVKNAYDTDTEIYKGSYEITPDVTEQVLATRNKQMTNDVTVHEIPYAETSNEFGTTAVIAS